MLVACTSICIANSIHWNRDFPLAAPWLKDFSQGALRLCLCQSVTTVSGVIKIESNNDKISFDVAKISNIFFISKYFEKIQSSPSFLCRISYTLYRHCCWCYGKWADQIAGQPTRVFIRHCLGSTLSLRSRRQWP